MHDDSLLQLIRDECDVEETGFVGTETLGRLLRSRRPDLDPAKLGLLLALAGRDGSVPYREFLQLLSSRRSSSFLAAVTLGRRRLRLGLSRRALGLVAAQTLPAPEPQRQFLSAYTCRPPPLFVPTVTLLQVCLYLYCGVLLDAWLVQCQEVGFVDLPIVYDPRQRHQAWRFISYALLHSGLPQLLYVVFGQLLIGVMLEMAHGTLPVALLYFSGVLAGSLLASVVDMSSPLVGGSGGLYALLTAHLALSAMNWADMQCPLKFLQMAVAVTSMSAELGRAVWQRLSPGDLPQPSFAGHVAGSLAGVTLGVAALAPRAQRWPTTRRLLWWVALGPSFGFLAFAIFWNVFAYGVVSLGRTDNPDPGMRA
uniref:rhomboid-related protein 1-like isoform X1 n=1 Tax=Myxine glutinosa TaxID=7769 RepID=UPI0035900241